MAPPKTDIANAVSFGVFATDANEDDDDTTLHQKVRADSGGAAAAAFTMAPPPSERISRLTSGSSSIGDASSDGGGMPPVLSRPYSRSLDLSMDKITMREQTITEVDVDKQEARSQWAKFLASTPNGASSSSQSHVADPNLSQRDKQYRIRSRFVRIGRRKKQTWWKEQTTSTVSRYLAWTYRAPFAIVIVTSYVWFMLLTVVFAAFIYIAARHQPGCITTATFTFMDSFHLSWTTLGTVGYGAVSPTMATTEQRWYAFDFPPKEHYYLFEFILLIHAYRLCPP
jgi:hypothetical protein